MRICMCLTFTLAAFAQTDPALTEAFFQRDPKQIMAECAEKAHALKGKDSRMLAETGWTFLAAGQRPRAEEAFRRAVAEDPEDVTTHFIIGRAWLHGGFPQEAIKAFDRIAALKPKAKNRLTQVAVCLMAAGEERDALRFMNAAYALDPQDWINCVSFGKAALIAKKLELAGQWFHRAVQAHPKDATCWNDIALAYAKNGAE